MQGSPTGQVRQLKVHERAEREKALIRCTNLTRLKRRYGIKRNFCATHALGRSIARKIASLLCMFESIYFVDEWDTKEGMQKTFSQWYIDHDVMSCSLTLKSRAHRPENHLNTQSQNQRPRTWPYRRSYVHSGSRIRHAARQGLRGGEDGLERHRVEVRTVRRAEEERKLH